MSHSRKRSPSRQKDDAKRTKRRIRLAPVLVPTSAPPLRLAPIAPAIRHPIAVCSVPLAILPAPSMQAAHQTHGVPLPVARPHQQVSSMQTMVSQHAVPQTVGAPTFHQLVPPPPIFMQSKLRSGKWHADEEVYADLLIEFFDRGLANCENGSTLRAFLAKRLHCSPMRISKKYAGKGIGKKVFLSKGNTHGDVNNRQMDVMMANTSAFFPSLAPFPPIPACSNVPVAQAQRVTAPTVLNPPTQSALAKGGVARHGHSHPRTAQGPSATPVANVALHPGDLQARATPATANPPVASRSAPIATSIQGKKPTPWYASGASPLKDPKDIHTAKLHKAYLTARKEVASQATGLSTLLKAPYVNTQNVPNQAPVHFQNSAMAASRLSVSQPVVSNYTDKSTQRARVGGCETNMPREGTTEFTIDSKSGVSISVAVKGEYSHPGQAFVIGKVDPTLKTTVLSAEILHAAAAQTNTQVTDQSAPASSCSRTAENQPQVNPTIVSVVDNPNKSTQGGIAGIGKGALQRPGQCAATASDAKELPDLLAGFDTVSRLGASQNQSTQRPGDTALQTMTNESIYQYSPPFTSRSFDDFHRFLGKDLAPLNGEVLTAEDGCSTQTQSGNLVGKNQSNLLGREFDTAGFQTSSVTTRSGTGMNADPYQKLSAAASEHSAFVPHVNMFDTTEEHLFYSDIGGALTPSCFREARESLVNGSSVSEKNHTSTATDAVWFSYHRDASVVSGSDRSGSDYCSVLLDESSCIDSESI